MAKYTKEKLACKLCAKNNRSTCTTPVPDSNHWICKAWLEKADKALAKADGKEGD